MAIEEKTYTFIKNSNSFKISYLWDKCVDQIVPLDIPPGKNGVIIAGSSDNSRGAILISFQKMTSSFGLAVSLGQNEKSNHGEDIKS